MTDCTRQLDFSAKARRKDPIQSHLAADKKNRSKTLSKDRLMVLMFIASRPGYTAKQLDLRFLLQGKAHRRSLELENLGLITRDKSGSEMTMYVTELGKEKLKGKENV